jgi:hypothetical protein
LALNNKLSALKSDLAQAASDLDQMRQDLATEAADLKLVHPGDNCSDDSYRVSSTDAYQVTGTDNYQVTGTDEYKLSTDLSAVKGLIAQLSSDMAKLTQESAAASYFASNAPSKSVVAALLRQAHRAVASAQKQWRSALATVKQLDAQAGTTGAKANAICG